MPAAPPVSHLFVYGSLRSGGVNPHAAFLHSACRSHGPASIPGRLFRNGTHLGALHEPQSNGRVIGEVMELPAGRDDAILTSLDRYEGIGNGLSAPQCYVRQCLPATLGDGTILACWAWLWNLPVNGMKHLRHGDFLKA